VSWRFEGWAKDKALGGAVGRLGSGWARNRQELWVNANDALGVGSGQGVILSWRLEGC
jgi:hypothetical protein